MEEGVFTFYDIFATKGIEYLIIIVFLILIIAFFKFVEMPPY